MNQPEVVTYLPMHGAPADKTKKKKNKPSKLVKKTNVK